MVFEILNRLRRLELRTTPVQLLAKPLHVQLQQIPEFAHRAIPRVFGTHVEHVNQDTDEPHPIGAMRDVGQASPGDAFSERCSAKSSSVATASISHGTIIGITSRTPTF